jgi:hypothetical protein
MQKALDAEYPICKFFQQFIRRSDVGVTMATADRGSKKWAVGSPSLHSANIYSLDDKHYETH